MSMIGMFRRISPAKLDELRASPDDLQDFLWPDEPLESEYDAFPELDIDKAWHGIHFLLNDEPWGEARPGLGFVVVGGTEIGEDAGYGPVRGFSADDVKVIQRALEAIDGATLVERFNADEFERNEVYPSGGWKDVRNLDYWSDYFDQLKAFIDTAVENKQALLVWLG
jgi:hypothetical protein